MRSLRQLLTVWALLLGSSYKGSRSHVLQYGVFKTPGYRGTPLSHDCVQVLMNVINHKQSNTERMTGEMCEIEWLNNIGALHHITSTLSGLCNIGAFLIALFCAMCFMFVNFIVILSLCQIWCPIIIVISNSLTLCVLYKSNLEGLWLEQVNDEGASTTFASWLWCKLLVFLLCVSLIYGIKG